MKKRIFLASVFLLFFPLTTFAAIARDNSAIWASKTGSGTITLATFTVSSSNPIIIACEENTTSAANITSFKANGTTMNVIDTNASVVGIGQLVVYDITGISGSVSITMTQTTTAANNYGVVASYSGAKQTGQPDAHTPGTGTSIAGFTSGATPVAANSWATQCGANSSTATTPGTGSNTVQAWSAASGNWFYDSNGVVTAGSNYAMTTTGPSANYTWDEVTIAPIVIAPVILGAPSLNVIGGFFKIIGGRLNVI